MMAIVPVIVAYCPLTKNLDDSETTAGIYSFSVFYVDGEEDAKDWDSHNNNIQVV